MKSIYNINEVALMTGFTTRTLRNYIKSGLLQGEKKGGVWVFTDEQVSAFFSDPNVKPGIEAKNRAVIFDFLADTGKTDSETCVILDLQVGLVEAMKIADFFCVQVSAHDGSGGLLFNFERIGGTARMILRGREDVVREIMRKYYDR